MLNKIKELFYKHPEEDEVIERTVSSRISIDAFNTTEEVLV